jgi:hypothetical protein
VKKFSILTTTVVTRAKVTTAITKPITTAVHPSRRPRQLTRYSNSWRHIHSLLSKDKVKDILFKLNMLGFEEEYDEKKDNLKSYLKGRRDAFKDVLDDVCDSGSGD